MPNGINRLAIIVLFLLTCRGVLGAKDVITVRGFVEDVDKREIIIDGTTYGIGSKFTCKVGGKQCERDAISPGNFVIATIDVSSMEVLEIIIITQEIME